ncbi:MAG: IPT/TIG domain-containing protein, partial [Bacteroidota bacterium]|nr:IPT/TIG domain-containing protein [Bacteroidota bacterium]
MNAIAIPLRQYAIYAYCMCCVGMVLFSLAMSTVCGEAQTIRQDMAQTNGTVLCVVERAGIFYIGGTFTAVINPDGSVVSRNRIAAIDASSGFATPWNPNANGDVVTLVPSGNILYVGGAFTSIGGQLRSRAAALDIESGLATAWNPQPNGTVFTMLLDGATMYMGGAFFQINGVNRFFIGAVSATGTGALLPWDPSADNFVFSLSKSGNIIYAGGLFLNIGGMGRPRIAALDATTGTATAWNPASNNIVLSVAATPSAIYAGGFFATIGGGMRQGVAALDPTTGLLIPSWNANCDNGLLKVLPLPSRILAGGNYTAIGGSTLSNLAALDASSGNVVHWTNSGTNGQIEFNAMTTVNGEPTVAVGGQFTTIGGVPRAYFAVLDQPAPTASFSQTAFTESSANDGSIAGTASITLERTSWLPTPWTILSTGTHYTVSGLPKGLSLFLRVMTHRRLDIQFIGKAENHTSSSSANVVITFTNAAVQNGNVAGISNLNGQTLKIQFIDEMSIALSTPPPPLPVISNISPLSGGAGTVVTIRGSNLSHVLGIRFGGVLARTTFVMSDSVIVATVDYGSSGRIDIIRSDTTILTPYTFTFVVPQAQAEITGLSQYFGSPGTRIVLTGRGFSSATGVLFGGMPVQSMSVDSDTQITVIVGAGASGTVTVLRPDGNLLLHDAFTYIPVPEPEITAIKPNPVLTGDSDYDLEVRGNNLSFWGQYTVAALSPAANGISVSVRPYDVSSTRAILRVPLELRRVGTYRLLLRGAAVTLSTTFSVVASRGPVITTQNIVSTVASGDAFTVVFHGRGFFAKGRATLLLNGTLVYGQITSAESFFIEVPASLNNIGRVLTVRLINFDEQYTEATIHILSRPGPFIRTVHAEWYENADGSPRLEFAIQGLNFRAPVDAFIANQRVRVVYQDSVLVRVVVGDHVPRPQYTEPPSVLMLMNPDFQKYGFRLGAALFYPVRPVLKSAENFVLERRNTGILLGLPIIGEGFQPAMRVMLDTLSLEILSITPQRCVVHIPQHIVFPEKPERRFSLQCSNPGGLHTTATLRMLMQRPLMEILAKQSDGVETNTIRAELDTSSNPTTMPLQIYGIGVSSSKHATAAE